MKALEWQRRLREQAELHGKRLFRRAELANLAGESRAPVSVQLVRLQRLGVVVRYASGLYGLPDLATLDDLLREVDDEAYGTGQNRRYAISCICGAGKLAGRRTG